MVEKVQIRKLESSWPYTVALLQAHLSKRIPRVRELAPYIEEDVDQLVYDFMQKDADKRPETSALAAKRLARLERHYAEQATNLRRVSEGELPAEEPGAIPDSAGSVPKEHEPKVAVVIKNGTVGAAGQVKVEQTDCAPDEGWRRQQSRLMVNLERLVSGRDDPPTFAAFSKESEAISAQIEKATSGVDCARASQAVEGLLAKYKR